MRIFLLLLSVSACSEYSLEPKIDNSLGADSGMDADGTDGSTPGSDPDEPDEPRDENAPFAVCDVSPNPVTPPFQAATFDGSGSYDPSGQPLAAYKWVLTDKPQGSSATLPFDSANSIPGFYADLAGNYTAQLTVTNQEGLTDICQVTLESLPTQDLWVEMFWDEIDDMDLHLLAPGGSFDDWDTDCYFSNCVGGGPDWGVLGDSSDDPSLDLDDINGYGPENINIYNPQSAGTYTVVVHDYSGSAPSDELGPNNVTVKVFLNGSLAWEETRAISGDDTVTPFCSINWGTMTVTSL
jgi:hypothetical protein